jgi:uncharacterized protein
VIICDTSALFAAYDTSQEDHDAVMAVLSCGPGPLILSPFVLAELDYLMLRTLGVKAELAMLSDVASGVYALAAFSADDIAETGKIVERYEDLRIGLTDASIVRLAARHRTLQLLSLDQRHFRAIAPAWGRRKAFTLLPADG